MSPTPSDRLGRTARLASSNQVGEPDHTTDRTTPDTNPVPPEVGPAPVIAGELVVPGYEVYGEIARGGMGVVYAARDRSLRREVAIKTMLPGRGSADVLQRFVTEAHFTARLPHPGVPPVHALGPLLEGRPFLAMKLIRGRTLADLLDARPDPTHDLPRYVQVPSTAL